MIRIPLAFSVVLFTSAAITADEPEIIDRQSTHHQTTIIKMDETSKSLKINAFCLDDDGHIVAVCGNGPGEVRVIDDSGKILRSWEMDVRPEAVTTDDSGQVLVGGEGKLFRFDKNGNELQQAESPHAHSLRTDTEKLRKQAIARLTQASSSSNIASRIKMLEGVLQRLEEKGKEQDLNDQEMKILDVLPTMLQRYQLQAEQLASKESGKEKTGPSEEQIQAYVKSLVASKMRISSVSASGDYVFVATQSTAGYGYDVWRTDNEFSNSKVIVSGLRGCCGQMDVQCCKEGVFVAENSRHRVVRYDVDGKELVSWGERDRTGVDGFSSCCNPMNVCFNGSGDVFTAESGTGRIKRFSADGKFVSFVGDVELVPGCKNVSVAVSPETDKVYLLDLTRNHIVMMQPKPADSKHSTASVGD